MVYWQIISQWNLVGYVLSNAAETAASLQSDHSEVCIKSAQQMSVK